MSFTVPDDCNFPHTESERQALLRVKERLDRTIDQESRRERLERLRDVYGLAAMVGLDTRYRQDLVHLAWCMWQGKPAGMTPDADVLERMARQLAEAYLAAGANSE